MKNMILNNVKKKNFIVIMRNFVNFKIFDFIKITLFSLKNNNRNY